MKPCRWIAQAGAAMAPAACLLVLGCAAALAAPPSEPLEWSAEEVPDALPLADRAAKAAKAQADTIWIADWTFDAPGGGCDDTGWTKIDNRIQNDGTNYWSIGDRFDGQGGITGRAAILAKHDLCWTHPDGYGNNWDYSIICKYRGAGSTLSFQFLSDSEPGYDFVTVEADSGGASEALVNYALDPDGDSPATHRDELFSCYGPQPGGAVTGLTLPAYAVPGVTHEVYVRLQSDGGYSDEDGLYVSSLGAGLVVDGIQVTGELAYTEDFEGVLHEHITLTNTANATPFGEWARLYQHITDNDRCNENTSCAWLWTDPNRPAYFSNMAFGPGGAVVHNWLDNIILGPWVSFGANSNATSTIFSMRRLPGNDFNSGRIVQNWSVRSKTRIDNTDSPTPGDSNDCLSEWGHTTSWNSLTSYVWNTVSWDMSQYVEPTAIGIQLRLRVSDWRLMANPPIYGLNTGPGPYNDRLRIGRLVVPGPVIAAGTDARSQAQDCFPTVRNGILPGEHYSPSTDRFGTCAFSAGADVAFSGQTFNVITGDSIWVTATDTRGVGGVTGVKWLGAIGAGPHAGKAPAPYTVGGTGFFEVLADSCRNASGVPVAGAFYVDLDDSYFRGGDVLLYYWYATDAAGGGGSLPEGITSAGFPPASLGAAETATNGLYEVSFLPAIRWDAGYKARIAADPHGDLEPTPAELANSTQSRCILYYQHATAARRSGESQRTAFMYTLDRLGYAGWYDVYDVQGYGNTNNQLGGRATIPQVSGYALLIEDDGRSNLSPNIPGGGSRDSEKVNQAQWYRDYLAQGATGIAGRASLWILGESTAYEKRTNPLFALDMGAGTVANDQGVGVNPDVLGVGSCTFWDGRVASFDGDRFALVGGCPTQRNFDAYTPSGAAVATHQYSFTGPLGPITGAAALLVNTNAAQHWNTVLMGFSWGDVADASGSAPSVPGPEIELAGKLLDCLVPLECHLPPGQTDLPPPEAAAFPRVTALHPNVPNPFNPVTVIRFDVARSGRVQLAIYDVAGRRVRELVAAELPAGFHRATWDGRDAAGHRLASGVYFYRLTAADFTATRKLLLIE